MRVGRDFVYDLQFWHNVDSGIWDLYHGTWWVDYNGTLRVLMTPNDEGDYDIEVIFNPYMVRLAFGDTTLTEDGVTEQGNYGGVTPPQRIITQEDFLISGPCGYYWDPPVVTGYAGWSRYVLVGGACYGDYTVYVDIWNSGTDTWVSDSVSFTFENPCELNQEEGGSLVANGVVGSRSEYFISHLSEDIVHHSGTVRYYVSDRFPQPADTIEITQVYEMVKRGDSGYGSPYDYAPVNLLHSKLEAYGEEHCWPGDCAPIFSTGPKWRNTLRVAASEISNGGCEGLLLNSEFVIAPRATTTSGAAVFELSYTPNGDSLVSPQTVPGTVGLVTGSSDYLIVPDQPLAFTVLTTDVCVSVLNPVAVTHFDVSERDGRVLLEWHVTADEDIAGFRVYRRTGADTEARLIAGPRNLPPESTSYVDTDISQGTSYHYRVAVEKADGSIERSMERSVVVPLTPVTLYQNRPNPFNPATTIAFTLPKRAHVDLSIYDIEGKLVKTLTDGPLEAGYHESAWDGTDIRGNPAVSGVYFYRLKAGKQVLTRKLVLLK